MGEGEGAASKVVPTEATLEAALIESLQERARRLERENAMVVRASPAAAAAVAAAGEAPIEPEKEDNYMDGLEDRVAQLQKMNVMVVAAQMKETKLLPTRAECEKAAYIIGLKESVRVMEEKNAMVVRASPAAAAAAAEEEARPPSLQKGTPLEKRVAKLQRVNVAVVAAQMEETARADRERMEARED